MTLTSPIDDAEHPESAAAASDVRPTLRQIRRADERPVRIGLILGSGLGAVAEEAGAARIFRGADLEGYPSVTAGGHAGELVIGELAERVVGIVRGRAHYYEGHPYERLGYPVRLLRALGARHLVVTNAAGGIRTDLRPGTFVLLSGHCRLTFPGRGPGRSSARTDRRDTLRSSAHPRSTSTRPGSTSARPDRRGSGSEPLRLVRRSPAYDPGWRARVRRRFRTGGLPVAEGTYGWTPGPSYETPAEIRALRRIGADLVGMSTIPEVVQARILGMHVLGISTVTNRAAGLGSGPLTHEAVVDVGARRAGDLAALIPGVLRDCTE